MYKARATGSHTSVEGQRWASMTHHSQSDSMSYQYPVSQSPISQFHINPFHRPYSTPKDIKSFTGLDFSKMTTPTPSQWYKDQFLISTSQALLQHEVVNTAFDSDYMYWTKRISDEAMKKMLAHSLCFGVYVLPESSSDIVGKLPGSSNSTQLTNQGRASPTQIGLGRVVTDESSFAYLTDVFIVPEYQRRGLGKWLIDCINKTFESWPDLRVAMLYAGGHDGENAVKFYQKAFGMTKFVPGKNGLEILLKKGPGTPFEEI
jgi:ribosomal protein S18 acetylase RimI-like enzyme